MTVNEMMKLLDSLSESAKEKPIVFCHNPSKDVCDEYVPEYDTSCCITKKDITIYIKKVEQ
ncbi:MAG: hypothetical protein MJZ81_11465 [Bacteroidales bacterium]|nr:hypothetical protein [Bacteroidales bacterium]